MFQAKHTIIKNTNGTIQNLSTFDYDLWKTLNNWDQIIKADNSNSDFINKQYNEFLKITDYKQITRIDYKKILKHNIESLINDGVKSIEEVINDAKEKGICLIDEKLEMFFDEKEYIYNRVKNVKYSEFQKLFDYLEGKTPFSTQHKTKGREFDNVLVILDNGNWNKYNFENLFLGGGTVSVLERTQKYFTFKH